MSQASAAGTVRQKQACATLPARLPAVHNTRPSVARCWGSLPLRPEVVPNHVRGDLSADLRVVLPFGDHRGGRLTAHGESRVGPVQSQLSRHPERAVPWARGAIAVRDDRKGRYQRDETSPGTPQSAAGGVEGGPRYAASRPGRMPATGHCGGERRPDRTDQIRDQTATDAWTSV